MTALLGPFLDLILFKITWLTLILGQYATLWLAVGFFALGLILNQGWRKQWQACLLIAFMGIAMDQSLTLLEVFRFPDQWIPLWLVLLWCSFAVVMPTGFGFLQKLAKPWQALFGAVGGTVAYAAAWKLGAVSFSLPVWQVLLIQSVLWGIFVPVCCRVLQHPPASQISSTIGCLMLLVPLLLPLRSLADAPNPAYMLLGSASFKVLWWPLYDASLYAQTEQFSFPETVPFVFSLQHQRDISRELLISETLKQWDAQQVRVGSDWETTLASLMPDVRKGDVLSMEVQPGFHTYLRLNNNLIGEVTDPDLVIAFAGIWLADTTTRPEFRQQLFGNHL